MFASFSSHNLATGTDYGVLLSTSTLTKCNNPFSTVDFQNQIFGPLFPSREIESSEVRVQDEDKTLG